MKIITPEELYSGTYVENYNRASRQGVYSNPAMVYTAAAPHIRPDMSRVLECGIGSGLSAAFYKAHNMEIHGVDISNEMLDSCAARGVTERKNLRRVDLELESIPYPDRSFDIVASHATLYLTAYAREIVENMADKVAPGGLLAFNFQPGDVEIFHQILNKAGVNKDGSPRHIPTYLHDENDITKPLHAKGLKPLHNSTELAYKKEDGTKVLFKTLVYQRPFPL